MAFISHKRNLWLAFGMIVLLSNLLLYRTSFGMSILTTEGHGGVVIGSLLDFAIIAPLALMLAHERYSVKKFILYAASGCIAARFIIPMDFLEPYVMFTWIGFAIEGALLLLEILLVLTLFIYLPKIIRYVKGNPLPLVFTFPEAINHYIRSHRIVQIISSELLMFYYAIGTWRQKEQPGITLYKNTSYIAMQIMIIHAIVLETLGIHWWLHGVAPIVSFVLLLLNVYSIFFFLGDLQAMRLTPILFEEKQVYISAGLMKQVKIPYELIDEVLTNPVILEEKLTKETLQFIVRDFEPLNPHVILRLKEPITATYYLGIQKTYSSVAIRLDQPERFLQQLNLKMNYK